MFKSFKTNQEYKEKNKLCVITGEKAKYFDPLTKQYYSNVEAFKILRENYFQKEEENLLFRIQTLSDLASQKKEKLKKLLLNPTVLNQKKNIMDIVNKVGILKLDANDCSRKQTSSKKTIYYLIYYFKS